MTPRAWETLSTELVLDHPWYRVRRDVVRLPDGRVVDDYLASVRPDVVLVCAVTPAREVVLVRQWKQGVRAEMLELPGGFCDPDEEAPDAARRELLEETGYACAELVPLGAFAADPTKDSHLHHLFLGRDARPAAEPRPDPQEEIEVELRPLEPLAAVFGADERTGVSTVAALALARDALGSG